MGGACQQLMQVGRGEKKHHIQGCGHKCRVVGLKGGGGGGKEGTTCSLMIVSIVEKKREKKCTMLGNMAHANRREREAKVILQRAGEGQHTLVVREEKNKHTMFRDMMC